MKSKTDLPEKVLPARFPSICGKCGRWIVHGELVTWKKGTRASHLTESQCAISPASVSIDRRQPSHDWALYESIGRALEAHPYKFARTYAETAPHSYTMRHQWADQDLFSQVVLGVKQFGYRHKFGSSYNDYLDVNEFIYWVMEPRTAPPVATTLINRAERRLYRPDDVPLFPVGEPPNWPHEMLKTLRSVTGDLAKSTVLDFGATWLDAIGRAGRYLAVATAGDIARLHSTHAGVAAITAMPTRFVPRSPVRFDVVAMLRPNTPVTEAEVNRSRMLLAPGGMLLLATPRGIAQQFLPTARLQDWGAGELAIHIETNEVAIGLGAV